MIRKIVKSTSLKKQTSVQAEKSNDPSLVIYQISSMNDSGFHICEHDNLRVIHFHLQQGFLRISYIIVDHDIVDVYSKNFYGDTFRNYSRNSS